MTIIIREVPGLTLREVLEAITDITDPDDQPISTGHGGVVVDEETAERFLSAYLVAAGKRSVQTRAPAVSGSSGGATDGAEHVPTRTTTRRTGKRKEE